MKFRNRRGELVDREEAEAMVSTVGIEVGYDVFSFDSQPVLIRSRLQPVFHEQHDPLYVTTVFGDRDLGTVEYPSSSEAECRDLHRKLVQRYLLVEQERQRGTSRVLLDGVL